MTKLNHLLFKYVYYPPITIDNTRMGDGGFFRGTSANQDARFLDKQKKLKAQMKFDPVLETKVIHFLPTHFYCYCYPAHL